MSPTTTPVLVTLFEYVNCAVPRRESVLEYCQFVNKCRRAIAVLGEVRATATKPPAGRVCQTDFNLRKIFITT